MQKDEIKDILILSFLKDGLAMRNGELVKQQKQVVMTLLANRKDILARKRAYRIFVSLENAISNDYRKPTIFYSQAIYRGKVYLSQNEAEIAYGKKYPRISRRVFDYLKSRMGSSRQRF